MKINLIIFCYLFVYYCGYSQNNTYYLSISRNEVLGIDTGNLKFTYYNMSPNKMLCTGDMQNVNDRYLLKSKFNVLEMPLTVTPDNCSQLTGQDSIQFNFDFGNDPDILSEIADLDKPLDTQRYYDGFYGGEDTPFMFRLVESYRPAVKLVINDKFQLPIYRNVASYKGPLSCFFLISNNYNMVSKKYYVDAPCSLYNISFEVSYDYLYYYTITNGTITFKSSRTIIFDIDGKKQKFHRISRNYAQKVLGESVNLNDSNRPIHFTN